MSKYKGNLISATQTVLSGTNYTGKANGKFSLSEQIQAKQSSLWAKGVGAPTAPTIGTATAGNTNASVTFTASSDAGAPGSLTYTATSTPGSFTNTGNSSPIVVSGLTNGTQYTFKVNATNALGYVSPDSGASNSTGTTVSSAPTIGTASTVSSNTINVSFTAPTNTGNLPITSYTATSSPGNITATLNQAGSGTIAVSGLSPSTSYTFTVTATNAMGVSLPSASSNTATTTANIPTVIGQAYGGGFYAGKINVSGTQYYLIVSPKATGESATKTWGPVNTITNITSVIAGPTNTASLVALGTTYQAATFCKNLSIGGYTDWYIPAKNELEVLYFNLKPTTTANNTTTGANANAVSPEPISTNYTSGSPVQTSAGIGFRTGEADAFASTYYWSSTEYSSMIAWEQNFSNGLQDTNYHAKDNPSYVRAVRRIAV